MTLRQKYSKHLDDPMTLKELEIWHSQEVQISQHPSTKGRRGKTWEETMSELNVTDKSISNTKRKTEYNALAQAMLEQKSHGIEQYVDNLIALTKATKPIIVRGAKNEASKVSNEPENTVRFNATSEIGDIFGAKAPKQVDLKHSMAAMGDDEIQDEIDKSIKEIEQNGRIQRAITSSFNAKAVVSTAIVDQKQTVDVVAREQATCPADN